MSLMENDMVLYTGDSKEIKKELHIYSDGIFEKDENIEQELYTSFAENLKRRRWDRYYRKYEKIVFHCRSYHRFMKRFFALGACWIFARKDCTLVNEDGREQKVHFSYLCKAATEFLMEVLSYKSYLKKCGTYINSIANREYTPKVNKSGIPYYIRNDYVMGFIAGGSVGHIAGIAGNINKMFDRMCLVTSDKIPTVDPDIHQYVIEDHDDIKFSNVRAVSGIYYNKPTKAFLKRIAKRYKPSFIYHRSALNQFSAIEFAIEHNVPLILEYNGSEVWIQNNWATSRLKTTEISEKIEMLCFEKASLIVCVSQPLKDQLLGLGVEEEKIIVVPNGVDIDKYNPDVDGKPIRNKYGIKENTVVVGFIGTFGAWHGTDVLAEAAVEILGDDQEGCQDIRFMFIGDGMMMPKVRDIVKDGGIESYCIFTGIVPQNEGRDYMAACDVLVSPTVPNPDGTPFFGSPTKLFEYMAMGKAIIVSDMDQMGEICMDRVTALMPAPGDREGLVKAILELAENVSLRVELGRNARKEVCEKYTWKIQTQKIMDGFEKRCEKE